MLLLGQYRELEAQTWLKLKLESSCIHCKHLEVKIRFSLGPIYGQKYAEVPKLHPVADWPQNTATTYCPTHFFGVRLDRTAPGPQHMASNACHQASVMDLILGLIALKSPSLATFSGPPPQRSGTPSIFLKKEQECVDLGLSSVCVRFHCHIAWLGCAVWASKSR